MAFHRLFDCHGAPLQGFPGPRLTTHPVAALQHLPEGALPQAVAQAVASHALAGAPLHHEGAGAHHMPLEHHPEVDHTALERDFVGRASKIQVYAGYNVTYIL